MSSLVVSGDTSGSVTLQAPAVAGSSVLTLPVATDTLVGKATTDALSNKTLVGVTGGTSAAAGVVGEYIEGTAAALAWPAASNAYGIASSIALTAGDWDVSVVFVGADNGASWSGIEVGISTSSGNNNTGMTLGVNWLWQYFSSVATNDYISMSIPSYRVSISGSATYYLKVLAVYTVATPTVSGRISARRVR